MANIKRANTSGITKSGSAIADVPDAPTIGAATNVGTSRAYNNGSATVAFTAAATGGTPASYTATSTPGSFTSSGAGSPLTVTGLQSATSYTFAVTATNATATGPASSASSSITATTVPAAPTIGTPTVASGQAYSGSAAVSVPFTAPATGGAAISSYTVTSSSGNTGTGSSSPISVTDTVSTARTYTVTATNANGTSTASSASASTTPLSVPQAPTIGTVTLSGTTASVPFTANATGGAAVSTYTATSSPGGFTGTGSSPISVSGLSAGTAYTFTVTATNSQGTSAASSASNSVTPVSYYTLGLNGYYPYATSINPSTGKVGVYGFGSGYGNGVLELDASGSVTANKYISSFTSSGGVQAAGSLGVDASGNYYFISQRSGALGNKEFYVVSYDSSFNVRWAKKVENGTNPGTWGVGVNGGAMGKDGCYYIWGYTYIDVNFESYYYVQKINSDGSFGFMRRMAPVASPIYAVTADASGNVWMFYYNQQFVVFNSSGTAVIRKNSNNFYNNGSQTNAVLDSAGNAYIKTMTSDYTKVILYKVNSSGAGVWGRTIATTISISGKGAAWTSGNGGVKVDSSDNVYVWHQSNFIQAGGFVAKYDSSGTLLWKRRFNIVSYASGGAAYTYDLVIDNTNNLIYFVGQVIFGSPYGNVGYIIKMPTDGSKTGTYDLLGGGYNMNFADNANLVAGSIATMSVDNNSYGTITNGSLATTDVTLTYATSSNFLGVTGVKTTI